MKTRVLITVKTYPTLSGKYIELVCNAGIREDGSWIRIYPVPYRLLEDKDKYKKWQWIELDLTKNEGDMRPESYRPTDIDSGIEITGEIDTKGNWGERKKWVLKNVYYNMENLIDDCYANGTSLATVKPQKIIDFVCKPCASEWDHKKLEQAYSKAKQGNLFDENAVRQSFRIVKKLPYEFSYKFITEDGKERTLMIEDWEIGTLYWNCYNKYKDEEKAREKVKEKYFEEMAKKRDLYLFVGTTLTFQKKRALNPFIIIGTFYPNIETQRSIEF